MSGDRSHISFAGEALESITDDAPLVLDVLEPIPADPVLVDGAADAEPLPFYEPPAMQPLLAFRSSPIVQPPHTTQLSPTMRPRGSFSWRHLLISTSNTSRTSLFVVCTLTAILWAFLLGMMMMMPMPLLNPGNGWSPFFRPFVLTMTTLSVLYHMALIHVHKRHLPDPITKQLLVVLAATVVLSWLSLVVEIRRWYF